MSHRTCRFIGGFGCLKLILAVAGVWCLGPAARGAVMLDQEHDVVSGVADSTNGNVTEIGQTFTVGTTGTLVQIDVFMFRFSFSDSVTDDVILSVYATSSGLPTGAALATVTLPKAQVPLNAAALVSFDVSGAGIAVNAGDVLAFAVAAASGQGSYTLPIVFNATGVDYAGGAAVRRDLSVSGPWSTIIPAADYGFQIWVDTVPEPTTAVLLLVGATTACLLRRSHG